MFRHKLRENEKLLKTYHRHWLTLWGPILRSVVLIFIPWYFAVSYGVAFSTQAASDVLMLWSLLILAYFAGDIVQWRRNYYMVTDQRLLHVSHASTFKKIVQETSLDRILNVSFRTTGILSSFAGYGTVSVQAAGIEEPMILEAVSDPEGVKDFIWQLHVSNGGGHFAYTAGTGATHVAMMADAEEAEIVDDAKEDEARS